MCNSCSKTIIEVLKQDRVYIVKYIVKSFSEFTLIFAVYALHLKITFFIIISNNLMTDVLDINTALLNEKIKIYRL